MVCQAQEEVWIACAAIAYVRRKEGDVDEIMPSLYAGRNGGMKKKAAVDKPTTPVVPAAPATDNHDAQAAENLVSRYNREIVLFTNGATSMRLSIRMIAPDSSVTNCLSGARRMSSYRSL